MATRPRVTIVGSSFVGLTTALAFAAHKIPSVLLDIDAEKVAQIGRGQAPFVEPGVDKALKGALARNRVSATSKIRPALAGSTHILICVGTPPAVDGSQDLRSVRAVARSIGQELAKRKGPRLTVVVKSTVVPGTTAGAVRETIEKASRRRAGRGFGLAANPEFLKEGSALQDALHPDRIVIGGIDGRSTQDVAALYSWARCPLIRTDPTTAEAVKYAANSFLATKISFANEFANYCAELGVDWTTVAEAIGHDARIGGKFLHAGAGFGGSCFPKDLKAIACAAKERGRPLSLVEAVLAINTRQPSEIRKMLEDELGSLEGKRVAVLGLSFKAGTDDIRESRAFLIVEEVIEAGGEVVCYDPLVRDAFQRALPLVYRHNFRRAETVAEAIKGCDAVVIQTEAKEFRAITPAMLKKSMRRPLLVDGRRILDPWTFRRDGVTYRGIGLGKR